MGTYDDRTPYDRHWAIDQVMRRYYGAQDWQTKAKRGGRS
jgi:hypothetical protein